eukprot:scaffold178499_cov30-Tisochrysis_lutea.AAC.4
MVGANSSLHTALAPLEFDEHKLHTECDGGARRRLKGFAALCLVVDLPPLCALVLVAIFFDKLLVTVDAAREAPTAQNLANLCRLPRDLRGITWLGHLDLKELALAHAAGEGRRTEEERGRSLAQVGCRASTRVGRLDRPHKVLCDVYRLRIERDAAGTSLLTRCLAVQLDLKHALVDPSDLLYDAARPLARAVEP